MSGKSISPIDSTHSFSTVDLCSRRNGVNHDIEEALNSLGGQIKISVHPILYMKAFWEFSTGVPSNF